MQVDYLAEVRKWAVHLDTLDSDSQWHRRVREHIEVLLELWRQQEQQTQERTAPVRRGYRTQAMR
jgi:hypothetical protein